MGSVEDALRLFCAPDAHEWSEHLEIGMYGDTDIVRTCGKCGRARGVTGCLFCAIPAEAPAGRVAEYTLEGPGGVAVHGPLCVSCLSELEAGVVDGWRLRKK